VRERRKAAVDAQAKIQQLAKDDAIWELKLYIANKDIVVVYKNELRWFLGEGERTCRTVDITQPEVNW
jgi:hypothetical protein